MIFVNFVLFYGIPASMESRYSRLLSVLEQRLNLAHDDAISSLTSDWNDDEKSKLEETSRQSKLKCETEWNGSEEERRKRELRLRREDGDNDDVRDVLMRSVEGMFIS